MKEPPKQLDGANVLCYCVFDQDVKPIAEYLIYIGGQPNAPTGAAICQYDKSVNIYLFYCTASWRVIEDQEHDTINDAVASLAERYSGAVNKLQWATV